MYLYKIAQLVYTRLVQIVDILKIYSSAILNKSKIWRNKDTVYIEIMPFAKES